MPKVCKWFWCGWYTAQYVQKPANGFGGINSIGLWRWVVLPLQAVWRISLTDTKI